MPADRHVNDLDNLIQDARGASRSVPFVREAPAEIPAALQSSRPAGLSLQAKQNFQEGIVHLQSGDAKAAVAALSRSVACAPDFTDARVFLGIAHSLTSNIYPAIDELEQAARNDPDSFAAHFTLAKLNFKLRIPQKGNEASREALRCVQSIDQRRMLTQLLMEERARSRNGIDRPWFNKPFRAPALVIAGVAVLAAIITVIARMH